MADENLNFIIAARDNASATMKRVSGELKTMGGAAQAPAGPLQRLSALTGGLVSPTTLAAGAIIGLGAAAVDMAKSAAQDEESQNRLAASLKANVPAFDGNTDAIEANITSAQRLGYEDEELRDALTVLVGATHDVGKAQEYVTAAMDLARFKGIDLRTASEALIKVSGGHYRMLAQLGIKLDENATKEEALAAVQKVSAGQAEAYADTAVGAAEAASIAFDELQESIGQELLPVMKELAQIARDDVVPALQDVVSGIGDLFGAIGTLDEAVQAPFDRIKQATLDLRNEILGRGKTAMTQGWAETWAALPPIAEQSYIDAMASVNTVLKAQAPIVSENTRQTIVNPMVAALSDARALARREMGALPGDIGEAITNNLGNLDQGLADLKDLMANSLSDSKKIAKLEGILASKELAAGLKDKRYDVRAAARQLQEDTRAELRKLKSGAADAAANGADSYAEWLERRKARVARAAQGLQQAAHNNLEFDASDAGKTAADTYIQGMATGIRAGVSVIGDALYYLKVNSIGGSLPRSGPMTGARIAEGARSIADKFKTELSGRLRGRMNLAGATVGSVSGAGGGGGYGGGVTLIIQSAAPPTPAQAADFARQFGPEIARWTARNT